MFSAHSFAACLLYLLVCMYACLLILDREWKGRKRENHHFVVPIIYAFIGCFLYLPDWGSNHQWLMDSITSSAISNLFCTGNLFTGRWGGWHGSIGGLGEGDWEVQLK